MEYKEMLNKMVNKEKMDRKGPGVTTEKKLTKVTLRGATRDISSTI